MWDMGWIPGATSRLVTVSMQNLFKINTAQHNVCIKWFIICFISYAALDVADAKCIQLFIKLRLMRPVEREKVNFIPCLRGHVRVTDKFSDECIPSCFYSLIT